MDWQTGKGVNRKADWWKYFQASKNNFGNLNCNSQNVFCTFSVTVCYDASLSWTSFARANTAGLKCSYFAILKFLICCLARIQGGFTSCFSTIRSGCFPSKLYYDTDKVNRTYFLTHWGRDKMNPISRMTFSDAFSWMKMYEFRLQFHLNLFLRVQLTII